MQLVYKRRVSCPRLCAHFGPIQSSRIRCATLADIAALVDIENASFPGDRLDRKRFRYLLTKANAVILVDADGDAIRSCLVLLLRADSAAARVYSVATHPAYLGTGAAARIVAAAERCAHARGCTTVRLEVRADNVASLALFRTRGYERFGRRPAYYHDGMDALRLQKRLDRFD